MEGGVEHTHLGQARHQLADGVHTLQVGGVVQRGQVDALLEDVEHLLGQHHRLVELLAAVHHAVADGVDLVEALDDADLGVGEQ